MVTVSNSYYSADDAQRIADYVQFRLFATVVGATEEASAYDLRLQDFLGKLATLQFIPAAVEYWGDQVLNETTTGTSETATYPDRRADLWKAFDRIQAEVQAEWNQMAATYGFIVLAAPKLTPKVSVYDNGRGIMKTMDPYLWPPEFRPSFDLFAGIPWGLPVGLPDPTDVDS